MAAPAIAATNGGITLQFSDLGLRDAQLRAAFGGYPAPGHPALAAAAGSRCPIGVTGSTPGTPQARRTDSDMPLFVPVAPHRLPVATSGVAEANSAFSGLPMPVIPARDGPHSVLPFQLGQMPQQVASIGAVKPSGAALACALPSSGLPASSSVLRVVRGTTHCCTSMTGTLSSLALSRCL